MCPRFTFQIGSMNKKFEAEKSFPGIGMIRKDGGGGSISDLPLKTAREPDDQGRSLARRMPGFFQE